MTLNYTYDTLKTAAIYRSSTIVVLTTKDYNFGTTLSATFILNRFSDHKKF